MPVQHWALKQLIAPPVEPITLTEAKAHLRVTISDDDALITQGITEARQRAEKVTGRVLVCQQWMLSQDFFAPVERLLDAIFGDLIRIPRPPLIEVLSVNYVDTTGTVQTLPTTWYQVDAIDQPARIRPAYGYYWPVSRYQLSAVQITYNAGHLVPFSVSNLGSSTFTALVRQPQLGEAWQLSNSGGALPAGLTAGTVYYVVNPSGFTFQLSLTNPLPPPWGGSPVTISDAGSGQSFLGVAPETMKTRIKRLLGYQYLNREASAEAREIFEALDTEAAIDWTGEYR